MKSQDIVTAVAALNVLINAAANAADVRQKIATAVSEGRDITDDELAQADVELGQAIDDAQNT
jgi:hypothetical protein